jgi:hypothetical protein
MLGIQIYINQTMENVELYVIDLGFFLSMFVNYMYYL